MKSSVIRDPLAVSGWLSATERLEFARLIILPVITGFAFGWVGTNNVESSTRVLATTLWVLLSIAAWLVAHVSTRLIFNYTRRWGAPLWATLAAGLLVAAPVTIPLNFAVGGILATLGLHRRGLESLPGYSLLDAASATAVPMLMWVGLNLAIHRLCRMPMYGYAAATPDEPRTIPAAQKFMPPFMQKMRPGLRGSILAVEAELHYIRVHTELGSDLLLYRFSDAVLELSPLRGAQVHRSWWAAEDYVVRRSARALELSNGLVVPIGRSFRVAAAGARP